MQSTEFVPTRAKEIVWEMTEDSKDVTETAFNAFSILNHDIIPAIMERLQNENIKAKLHDINVILILD